MYLYRQRFQSGGKDYWRASLLARVRLEPWEAGVVLPHEKTMAKPKSDRLKLLRACAANLSPIMVLYQDEQGTLQQLFKALNEFPPEADFTDDTPACTADLLHRPVLGGPKPDVLVAHNCEFERKFILDAATAALLKAVAGARSGGSIGIRHGARDATIAFS